MTQTDPTNKIARSFIWLAWIAIFGLLVFVFNDYIEKQHNPNQSVNTRTTQQGRAEVILQQNRYGHYVTAGTINQRPVVFLLDTGATEVSIPTHIAEQLNLTRQQSFYVSTANGRVKVYQTDIAELSIGDITLYNVAANINPGMQSNEILLGMSALKQVQFRQSGKQLILEY